MFWYYSIKTQLIRTWLFRIPRYIELKIIFSLGFTIGYFELPLLLTVFRFPCEFEIATLNCIYPNQPVDEIYSAFQLH